VTDQVPPSWNAIFEALARRRLDEIYDQPEVAHDDYVATLRFLSDAYSDAALQPGKGIEHLTAAIITVLNPTKGAWKTIPSPGIVLSTVDLLRRIENIPGYKIFKTQFAQTDNRGMLNQLYATAYLQKFLPITGIEQKLGCQDVDILTTVSNEETLVHVKSIDQLDKMTALFTASSQISRLLHAHPGREATGRWLVPRLVTGIAPKHISYEYWCTEVPKWKYDPQELIFDWPPADRLRVVLDWAEADNFDNKGRIDNVDVFRNFNYHVQKIEKDIPQPARGHNLIVGVLAGLIDVADIRVVDMSYFESLKTDAVFFLKVSFNASSLTKLQVKRSAIIARSANRDYRDALERCLPSSADL
jgi:hypothetical protein